MKKINHFINGQEYISKSDRFGDIFNPASGEKINGGSANGLLTVSTEGQGLTFVYVDSTVGWKTVHENDTGRTSEQAEREKGARNQGVKKN